MCLQVVSGSPVGSGTGGDPTPPVAEPTSSVTAPLLGSSFTNPFLHHLFENQLILESGWIHPNTSMPVIPPFPKERLQSFLNFLNKPFLPYNQSCASVLKILSKEGGRNFLGGSYLLYLFGSKWFISCAAKFARVSEEQILQWISADFIEYIDSENRDVDLFHKRANSKDDPEIICKSLLTKIAGENNLRDASEKFTEFHPQFFLDIHGAIEHTGFLIKHEDNEDQVDINVITHSKHSTIYTLQNLYVDFTDWLNDPSRPIMICNDPREIYQTVIDLIGKAIHLQGFSHMALIRSLSKITLQNYRMREKFPPECFENLRKYLKLHEAKKVSPISYLIHREIKIHFDSNFEKEMILAFHLSHLLYENKFSHKEIALLWKGLAHYIKIWPAKWKILQQALEHISFELVLAMMSLHAEEGSQPSWEKVKLTGGLTQEQSLKIAHRALLRMNGIFNKHALEAFKVFFSCFNQLSPKRRERAGDVTWNEQSSSLLKSQFEECHALGFCLLLNNLPKSRSKEENLTWIRKYLIPAQTINPSIKAFYRPYIEENFPELKDYLNEWEKGNFETFLLKLCQSPDPFCFEIVKRNYRNGLSAKCTLDLVQAVSSKPLDPENIQLITRLMKDLLVMNSHGFLDNALEVIQKHFKVFNNKGFNLLYILTREKIIDPFVKLNAECWYNFFSNFLRKSPKDGAKIFSLGKEQGVWKKPEFFVDITQSLIEDIQFIYGKNDPTFQPLAHDVINALILHKKNQKFHAQIEGLKIRMENEKRPFDESQKELQVSATALFKRIQDPLEPELLIELSEKIIIKLCETHGATVSADNNLQIVKLLLNNNHLRRLFSRQTHKFQHFHNLALRACIQHKIDDATLSAILESALIPFQEERTLELSPELVNSFLEAVKMGCEDFPKSLKNTLQICHERFVSHLLSNNDTHKLFFFIVYLSRENIHYQYKSYPEFYTFFNAVLLEIKKLSAVPEKIVDLRKILHNLHKCIFYPPPERCEVHVVTCLKLIPIIEETFPKDHFFEVSSWIDHLLYVCANTPQHISPDTLTKLISLILDKSRTENHTLLSAFIESLNKHLPTLESGLSELILSIPDNKCYLHPRTALTIILNSKAHSVVIEPSNAEIQKIKQLALKLLTNSPVDQDLEFGMEILESNPECGEVLLQPLLESLIKHKSESLKMKGFRNFRTLYLKASLEPFNYYAYTLETWKKCFILAVEILVNQMATMPEEQRIQLLDSEENNFLFHETIQPLLSQHFLKTGKGNSPLFQLFHLFLSTGNSFKVPQNLLEKLWKLRNFIKEKQINTAEIDALLISFVSDDVTHFKNSCSILDELLSVPSTDKQLLLNIYGHFLMQASTKFPTSSEIHFMLEKMVSKIMLIPNYDKLNLTIVKRGCDVFNFLNSDNKDVLYKNVKVKSDFDEFIPDFSLKFFAYWIMFFYLICFARNYFFRHYPDKVDYCG